MEQLVRKLPIGIQSFESLRKDNYLYVDKTKVIFDLINLGRYFFLSRPRRFGKSLLLSTIKAYFEGKRELFDGLALSKKEVEWVARPVLYLDLNTNAYDDKSVLVDKLADSLSKWEQEYGLESKDLPLGMRFEKVIEGAYKKTGHRVAILVDEYDKPMLQAIGNKELQEDFRSTLKGFYGALKSMDSCIKFAMLTGVTKFGKVSVFSDLNNLNDISMDAQYYDICGITEEELKSNFSFYIKQLAEANSLSIDECLGRLKEMYDGYHFEESVPGVYNPFSLLNAFSKKKFGSYWFESGTPTYLVKLLQLHDYKLEKLDGLETSAQVLNSIDSGSTNPVPTIYQSGYLTIKGYDPEFGLYKLGYPNKEVEEGFLSFLLPYYSAYDNVDSPFELQQFVKDVKSGNVEQFIERLRSFFSATPYDTMKDVENYYQNVLLILFRLAGFYIRAEYRTSRGRIDLLLESQDYRYVMELKLDKTAEEALTQIKAKEYALSFAQDAKKTYLIGLNFSSQTRNIDKYVIE
ncbi:MAG: ATP-binding protein [Bacteroidales bacterium]|nr:ATP-binding protein [Bacteroidales bacterium]